MGHRLCQLFCQAVPGLLLPPPWHMNNPLLKFTFLAVDNQQHRKETELCSKTKKDQNFESIIKYLPSLRRILYDLAKLPHKLHVGSTMKTLMEHRIKNI